jgi:hypothetical protein
VIKRQQVVPRNDHAVQRAYKIDADDELRFAPLAAFYFCHAPTAVTVPLLRVATVSLLLHGIARRRLLRLLSVHRLRVLRRVGVAAACIDGRRRHG